MEFLVEYGSRPSVCMSVVVVWHGCIVAKRCEIGPKLLLSYIDSQMTCKSVTLYDLKWS